MARFDVYGRFVLEIERERGKWVAYRAGTGTRRRETSLVLPETLSDDELPGYLDDIYHEYARPGRSIRRL